MGFGGVEAVGPFGSGMGGAARGPSTARAFGAGFGTGTGCCANAGDTIMAAASAAAGAVRV